MDQLNCKYPGNGIAWQLAPVERPLEAAVVVAAQLHIVVHRLLVGLHGLCKVNGWSLLGAPLAPSELVARRLPLSKPSGLVVAVGLARSLGCISWHMN